MCEDKSRLLVALNLFTTKNIDLIDAFLSVKMIQEGIQEIYSFDQHFERLPGIQRLTPGEAI
jgi:predicted nucleic acid-binding protein